MTSLFDMAFARLDHARVKHDEFGSAWSAYIDNHPWDPELVQVDSVTFEARVTVRQTAPPVLGLTFSDWLANLRAALDNGLYAWAVAIAGQDPPPDAGKLQFPIAVTRVDFDKQAKRLRSLPDEVVAILEGAQPYHSPYGHESNILYWIHELARVDRHRSLHVGLGRIGKHHVKIGLPPTITASFDTSVEPYEFIDKVLVIARFTVSKPVDVSKVVLDPDLGIDPEIKAWQGFRLNGAKAPLQTRMFYTELFIRNHLENMALYAGQVPPGGFRTFEPNGSDTDD